MKSLRSDQSRSEPVDSSRSTRRRLDRGTLSLVVASLALLIAVSGITPADAAKAVKRALNADTVDGVSASRTPKAGQLLPLGSNGKFPSSVLPAGTPGPRGPRGAEGPAGGGSASRTVFRAHAVALQSTKALVAQKVLFGAEDFDPEDVFNPATSLFTAPLAGYYRFEASVMMGYIGVTQGAQRTLIRLISSRSSMHVRGTDEHSVGYQQATVTGLMQLERGDTVEVNVHVEPPEGTADVTRSVLNDPDTSFSGSLVAPL